jgi:hypothetical protein
MGWWVIEKVERAVGSVGIVGMKTTYDGEIHVDRYYTDMLNDGPATSTLVLQTGNSISNAKRVNAPRKVTTNVEKPDTNVRYVIFFFPSSFSELSRLYSSIFVSPLLPLRYSS